MASRIIPSFNPSTDQFYFCRMCKTHIAKTNDLVTHFHGFELADPYFITGMNVHILNPSGIRRKYGDEIVDVHCVGCNNLLGIQNFVTRDGKPLVSKCMLDLKRLMKWDGKKIVDGAESAEYYNWCKHNLADFSMGRWFADSPAGHAGWDAFIRVVRFDASIDQFFICRLCGTEIAKAEDYLRHHEGVDPREPVFGNIINVHTSNAVEQIVKGYRVILRSVHCNKCGNLLGKHYLEPPRADGEPSGRAYIPDLTKFMYWDGQKFIDGAMILECFRREGY